MKTKPNRSPLPSQIELATLAASLPTGSATERLAMAFALWYGAADVGKIEREFYQKFHDEQVERAARHLITLPLPAALDQLLPETPRADRAERWKKFRQHQLANGGNGPSFSLDQNIGVSITVALFDELAAWEAGCKAELARTKSSNAANARWDKARERRRENGEEIATPAKKTAKKRK